MAKLAGEGGPAEEWYIESADRKQELAGIEVAYMAM